MQKTVTALEGEVKTATAYLDRTRSERAAEALGGSAPPQLGS
jgi:hypothetical protein